MATGEGERGPGRDPSPARARSPDRPGAGPAPARRPRAQSRDLCLPPGGRDRTGRVRGGGGAGPGAGPLGHRAPQRPPGGPGAPGRAPGRAGRAADRRGARLPQVLRHPVRPGGPAGGRRGRRPRRAGLPPLHRGPPVPRLPVGAAAPRGRGVPLLLTDLEPAQRWGVRDRRRPRHDHPAGRPGGRRVPDRGTPGRRGAGRCVSVPELRPVGRGRPLVPELHDRQQLHPPGRAGVAQRGVPGRRPGPARCRITPTTCSRSSGVPTRPTCPRP